MAVRDDFTAGEVLAAADLNDTFASKLPYSFGTATPSTTDSGFLWYDSNSTPAAPKFWDGSAFQNLASAAGLELITNDSLSGSAVNVNGCFTSTYQRYRLLARVTSSAADTTIQFRLRASGSDITGTSYSEQIMQASSSSVTGTRSSSNAQWRLSVIGSTAASLLVFDIDSPQLAQSTHINGNAESGRTNPEIWMMVGMHSDSTSVDGFTLLAASGTFGGNFSLYGYKD